MTSRDFCYWLQGFYEISNPTTIGEKETDMIKRHLALVFIHEIDPSMPDPDGKLQAVHDGTPIPKVNTNPSIVPLVSPPHSTPSVVSIPPKPSFPFPPGSGLRC